MALLHVQYVVKSSYIIHNQYINYHKVLNIIVAIPAGRKAGGDR